MTRSTGAHGLTLIEVMVSSAILALLALAILSATVPMSDGSAELGAAIDMDRDAAKFMTQLRRELRQSGYQGATVHAAVSGGGSTLTFEMRQDPSTWSSSVVYSVTAAAGRNKIVRAQNGLTTDVILNVQSVQYTLPANASSVGVTLTLVRRGVKALPGGTVPDIVRTYTDQIEMMNRP